MFEKFEQLRRMFAEQLYDLRMFKDKTRSPQGKGFRLKLHQTKPDAPLSPYYLDLRVLRSYPRTAKAVAVKLFEAMGTGLGADVLADVPTAITPVVSSLSDLTGIPMITPRLAKDHGTGGDIDGNWSVDGATAVLFDDLVTEAHSKIEAATILRGVGITVKHVVVLVDREQGGRRQLEEVGLTLHTAFTITELLALYREIGKITPELHAEIEAYRAG
jgi:orotate phosphoribosyltransferase